MLNFAGNDADMRPFTAAASKVALPLEAVTLNDASARKIYERPFVLVRPDGHVAWRGDFIPETAAAIIDQVRGVK